MNENEPYNVYIDETGQVPYYNDMQQPVLTLAGVITKNENKEFDQEIASMLQKYQIEGSTEIHAKDIFDGKQPFINLNHTEKQRLILDFLSIGNNFSDFFHFVPFLKPFFKTKKRNNIRERNLDPFLYILFCFVVQLDFYFYKKSLPSYNLIFDEIEKRKFNRRTKEMIKELCSKSKEFYYLKKLNSDPTQMNSRESRFIQLADVVCYTMARYQRLAVKTFRNSVNLQKYRDFYQDCYDLIKKKVINILPMIYQIAKQEDNKIWNKLGFDIRDFKHKGKKWLTEKKKGTDAFDPNVSTYWSNQNYRIKKENLKVKIILESDKIEPEIKIAWLNLLQLGIKRILKHNEGLDSDFPEIKKSIKLIDDFKQKNNKSVSIPELVNHKKNTLKLIHYGKLISRFSEEFETLTNIINGLVLTKTPKIMNIGRQLSQKEKNPKENLLHLLSILKKISSIYKDTGNELELKKKEYDIVVDNLVELFENIISYQNILNKFYRIEITKLNKIIQKLFTIIHNTEENLGHFKTASNHFRDIGAETSLTFKNIDCFILKNEELKKQCENFQKRFR